MYEVTEWNSKDFNTGIEHKYDILKKVHFGDALERGSSCNRSRNLTLFRGKVDEGSGSFVVVLLQPLPFNEDKDDKGHETIGFRLFEGRDTVRAEEAFHALQEFFSILMSNEETSYSLEQIQKLITPKGPVSKKDLLVHLTQFDIPGPLSHEDLQTHLYDFDEGGNSLLHLAAKSGSYHTTKHLLLAKESPDCPIHLSKSKHSKTHGFARGNHKGENPLIVAAQHGKLRTLLLLLHSDSDPNSLIAKSGNTALHIAASSGFPLIVKALILFGANVDAVNNEGKTALEVAMATPPSSTITECVKILQEIKSLEDNKRTFPKKPITHSPTSSRSAPVLLCLDGGGIRGLVEAIILSELDAIMRELDPGMTNLIDYFDFTAGTSTGSFIVASLVYLKHPPSALKKMYFSFKDSLFIHKKPIRDSVTNKAAKEAFGESLTMKDVSHPMVMITTTIPNNSPPILHLMCNYGGARNGQKGPEERKVWEACRASSAAPTYFESFENQFVDGGVIANNPTLDAMTEVLNHQEHGKEPPCLGMVVSLGTGVFPVTIDHTSIPHIHWWNPLDVLRAIRGVVGLLNLMIYEDTSSNGAVVERAKTWCKSIGCPYFRISPDIDPVKLDETDDKILIKMMYQALIYARENRSTLEEIAITLLSRRK